MLTRIKIMNASSIFYEEVMMTSAGICSKFNSKNLIYKEIETKELIRRIVASSLKKLFRKVTVNIVDLEGFYYFAKARNFLHSFLKQHEQLSYQALQEVDNLPIDKCKEIILSLQDKKELIEKAFKIVRKETPIHEVSDIDYISLNIVINFTKLIEAIEDKIFDYDYDNMTDDFFSNIIPSLDQKLLDHNESIEINTLDELFNEK